MDKIIEKKKAFHLISRSEALDPIIPKECANVWKYNHWPPSHSPCHVKRTDLDQIRYFRKQTWGMEPDWWVITLIYSVCRDHSCELVWILLTWEWASHTHLLMHLGALLSWTIHAAWWHWMRNRDTVHAITRTSLRGVTTLSHDILKISWRRLAYQDGNASSMEPMICTLPGAQATAAANRPDSRSDMLFTMLSRRTVADVYVIHPEAIIDMETQS